MPSAVASKQPKRKTHTSNGPPAKRRRSSSVTDEDPSAQIMLMEQGILESRKHYNDITKLLQLASEPADDGPKSMLAAVALCRVFVRLLAQGSLLVKKSLSEKDAVVAGWLKDQLAQYKLVLLSLLKDEESASPALTLCMRVLQAEGQHLYDKDDYMFPKTFLQDVVEAVMLTGNEEVRRAYIEEYAEQYDDIRYFTFASVKRILKRGDSGPDFFEAGYSLLAALDGVPESSDDLEDFYIPAPQKKSHPLLSVAQHKRQGQEAWLALMDLTSDKAQRKQLLGIVSTIIAPWFIKPELLADFLTDCYNTRGSMALLALSGVFYLIQERNLDYPSFYSKLYSLLDQDILHSKHRSRFFRLLDIFLASTHLPAALVASFIKRLCRLALNAPPSAIVVVIPWTYNLLKKHPTCTFMVHRETRDPTEQQHVRDNGLADPFMATEPDPLNTNAINSSLWELAQLQSHYHPNVATIAKIVSEQFTKQAYSLEDFLDHSYASLLEAELGKDVKKAPVVEFQIPKRIFTAQDAASTVPDSLLVKAWDFEG